MDLANQQKKMNDLMDYLASIANNERNNDTKYGVAGINNKSKEGIAAGNNESRETIASSNNTSRETVAGMNNSSRESIANINNSARASLLREKVANGTATTGELSEDQAYKNYTKALETNGIFPGTIPQETVDTLKARIDSFQKKN